MQTALKRNAIIVLGFALFFWWAWWFAKHDPVLRRIIPFGEDPYDAVSSFGVIAAILLALVSMARAFFPVLVGRSGRPIYVLRAQIAVPFCVLVTIAAEVVAMLRHTSKWFDIPGCGRLLTLMATLAVSSFITLSLLMNNGKIREHQTLKWAAAVWSGTIIALAIYPERLILGTPGHLITIEVGAVLLFVPVSALVKAWLPETMQAASSGRQRERVYSRYVPFAIASVGELYGGGSRPAVTQTFFVGSVYAGLGAVGLVIGYAWLGRLLGFTIGEPELQQC